MVNRVGSINFVFLLDKVETGYTLLAKEDARLANIDIRIEQRLVTAQWR